MAERLARMTELMSEKKGGIHLTIGIFTNCIDTEIEERSIIVPKTVRCYAILRIANLK